MIKRITGKWVFFILVSVLMYVVCTEYPNPFQDQSLSKATLGAKTFQNGDTVLIFSRETVSVVTYLREHVKEVAVHIDDNRLWKSSDTFFNESELTADPIILPISFYKIGWHKIVVTTTFKNDETRSETDSLFAKSPLSQQSITAMVGDSIHLKTDPVKDDDVFYVWDFKDDNIPIYSNYAPQYDFVLKSSFSSLIGVLYVIDRTNHSSPLAIFETTASSATKLSIKSLNESLHGDTIYTGESNLTLKVLINGNFKGATVNGLAFDNKQESTNGVLLSKTFSNLDTLSDLMKIIVKVEGRNSDSLEKTFFIKYDVNQTNLPEISVTFPSIIRDTSFVQDSSLLMMGKVTGHAQYEKLYLRLLQNGFLKGYCKVLSGNDDWEFNLNLVTGWNKVRMDLTKDSSSSSVLISKEVQIKLDSTMKDLQPPSIKDIKVNGIEISGDKNFTSSTASALLTMTVLDHNAIKSVTVNNDTARVQQDGKTYSASILPVHKVGGTQYILTATDVAGNVKADTLTGLFNRSPRIEAISIPSSMLPDSVYAFVVKVSDGDTTDKLVKTINILSQSRDTSITLANDTVIWKPSITDTGKNTIVIRVSDGFLDGDDDTTVISTVYQKTDKPRKVTWLTNADDFPDSIVVGKESLSQLLKVTPNTGVGPFTYTVSIYSPSEVIYQGENAQFSWTPTRSDAGVRTLRFIVLDKNNESDTLDILMTIIARASGTVYLAEQSMNVNESSTDAAVAVRLSTKLADSVKVTYTIKFQSANSQDLNMIPTGIVWFAPGDTSVRLPINIINDTGIEEDEIFKIELSDLPTLSDKDSISVDKNKSAVEVTIRDDDQRTVKYSFFGSAKSGSEKLKSDTIIVELDTTLDRDIELTYVFDKTSSANDSDFSFASTDHTLKFKAGTQKAFFVILITNDTKAEKDDVIKFSLQSTDSSATPGTYTTFEYTIVDDDAVTKVGVMLQPSSITLPEGAVPNIGVVLTGALKNDITVTIRARESSTARGGGYDYTIPTLMILVKANVTSQSIGLRLTKDNTPELTEWVEFEIIGISDTVNAEISPTLKNMRVTITD